MAEQTTISNQSNNDQANLNKIKALLRDKEPKLDELLDEALK